MNRAVQRSQLFNPAGQQTRSQYDPQNPGVQHRGPAGPAPQQQYQQYQQYQQPQQQGQPQQQQQQQQQQLSQQGPQSTNGTADGASGSGSTPGQEMNLASVLHYLQSEWRRWERDRNEWEIERAEMRVCWSCVREGPSANAYLGPNCTAGRTKKISRKPQGRFVEKGQNARVRSTTRENKAGWCRRQAQQRPAYSFGCTSGRRQAFNRRQGR